VLEGLTLAYQQLHVLPELLTVVLYPRGRFRVTGDHQLTSRLQWSQLACRWKVVELWQLKAEELLAAGDVGLVPWVPLRQFQGPPAPVLEACRQRIDTQARSDERDNLLAVSQRLSSWLLSRKRPFGILYSVTFSPILSDQPLSDGNVVSTRSLK